MVVYHLQEASVKPVGKKMEHDFSGRLGGT